MLLLRTFVFHLFHKFLKPHNISSAISTIPLRNSAILASTFSSPLQLHLSHYSFLQRNLSATAQLASDNVVEDQIEAKTGFLSDGCVRVLGVDEENGPSEEKLEEQESPSSLNLKKINGLELKSVNLENNENGVKGIAEKAEKEKETRKSTREDEDLTQELRPRSLYSLFASKSDGLSPTEKKKIHVIKQKIELSSSKLKRLEEVRPVAKEISPEMLSLISRFYEEGLLNSANFLPLKNLELSSLSNPYFRDFLLFTAERFAQDHQEIAKWLSGSHLKKIALFGCPSVERKTTYAAKRLRSFFSIHEDTVCGDCKLRSSCKFVNKKVWSKVNNLNLADAMRILTSYALDSVPSQLVVPYDVKDSVSKLLTEVINLSK